MKTLRKMALLAPLLAQLMTQLGARCLSPNLRSTLDFS
jgi:hypothetical protein